MPANCETDGDAWDFPWLLASPIRIRIVLIADILATIIIPLILKRLRTGLARSSNTPNFSSAILTDYLYFRHREEPVDGIFLSMRQYVGCQGAIPVLS